jgi:4-diphosphocytidyl-2-C-methyl-D-erythritol kinase
VSPSVLTVQTPAKINPVLEILGKRPDGFHELILVFQAVGFYDELSFSETSHGVELSILESPGALPTDDSNLIVKAAHLFLKEVLKDARGVRVELKKRIPLAAGLGGGSSDAAATLRGLQWLFQTKASEEKLQDLAARLGSDVPFFLTGGTALGTGRGEKITPWNDFMEMHLVLVKPAEGLSTQKVYGSGKALITSGEKARNFNTVLRQKNLAIVGQSLMNGLEPAAFHLMPEIAKLKRRLLEDGAVGALVSGSGPTVFALTESREKAETIARLFQGEDDQIWVTQTVATGVQKI